MATQDKTSELQWVRVESFKGRQTKLDPCKIDDGACPVGYNTTFRDGDVIATRSFGYEKITTEDNTAITDHCLYTFRKRDGSQLLIRGSLTYLQYFDPVQKIWEIIKGGYSNTDFGFALYNINTDLKSYVYFCNGVEPYSRWTGAITNLTSALNNSDITVNVVDTTDFAATGTIVINGVEVAYSAKTPTTFTITAWAGGTIASGRGVSNAVQEYASAPRGNILMTANNRVFVCVDQAAYFSKYGDATDFSGAALVTTSTATSAGIFNLGEGGGKIIGVAMDEGANYFFKKNINYKTSLTDALYSILPLKPFDGKSQVAGASNKKSVFTTTNGVIFITSDNQILFLTRLDQIDYPQSEYISSLISQDTINYVFDESVGITYRDKAYIACKSSKDVSYNDIILVWNATYKMWDNPITGVNVADFSIYDADDGDGEKLYFAHSITNNVYRVIDEPVDDIYDVESLARTKQYNFGLPERLKVLNNLYIEGYIKTNTVLTIRLLLNEEGITQTLTTTVDGTKDIVLLFSKNELNTLGEHPLGVEVLGANPDVSGMNKFRVYLLKDMRDIPFFNLQLEFSSDGSNQQWEIIQYAMEVKENNEPLDRKLFKAFKK